MKKAYVFPGQGSQFPGMGHDLYTASAAAKEVFTTADKLLGFSLSEVMFTGTEEDLKRTEVTQPAIFVHSMAVVRHLGHQFNPQMVAGHSLGEFSALCAAGALSFEDALILVSKRAKAMQAATEHTRGGMAAILGMDDETVEQTIENIDGVVCANYNCPGQLVISGRMDALETACARLLAAGAKRAMILPVGGAFHSPLMEPAKQELTLAIGEATFNNPICPVYQNVTATPVKDALEIRRKLIEQLTQPVMWTQTMKRMIADGATVAIETGPGKVLQGLFKKVDRAFEVASAYEPATTA